MYSGRGNLGRGNFFFLFLFIGAVIVLVMTINPPKKGGGTQMYSGKSNLGRGNGLFMFLFVVALVTFVGVFLLAGCGQEGNSSAGAETDAKTAPAQTDESSAPGTPKKDAKLEGSITVAGSTSVQPVSELLAEAFMDMHSGVTVNVQGGGSSAGIQAAVDGVAEIGASSRDLRESEQHLNEIIIGQDGIAVVVHPSNEVDDLTLEQIKDIFAGKITNWSEVGGANAGITGVTREEGSGTRGAFEEIVMGDAEISPQLIVQNSTGACKTTVAGDSNAISYISLAALDQDVKAVKVNGAEVTTENIVSGDYVVARPFIYVTDGAPAGVAKAYLDFVVSPEAQPLIENAGLVSIH